MRKILVLAILPLLLSACGRAAWVGRNAAPMELMAPADPNQSFSFVHMLMIDMPRASVAPRFERARQECLKDVGLRCKLLSSSFENTSESYGAGFTAHLVVALPHEEIERFEQGLLAAIVGENPNDVTVRSRSTRAENVTQVANTAERKASQLANYRDRLLALSKRPNLSVDDLIKVESELAKTQSDLDDAQSRQSDADEKVAKEQLSIFLNEKAGSDSAFQPIVRVWQNAMDILGESTANVLQFLIQLIPWLPVLVGAIFLLRWLWRIARRREPLAKSAND